MDRGRDCGNAAEQTIDVLWYAFSPPGSETQYREQIQELADDAHNYEPGSGVRWRLAFFGPGDPEPDFSAYDVLVIESSLIGSFEDEGFGDYSGILDNSAAIAAVRGSRTLITGADPDLPYIRGNKADDGPRGLLVNFVNWAGSGTGLGIVALDNEEAQWWVRPQSFLYEELTGRYFADCCFGTYIPDDAEDYPINAGISDAAVARFGAQTGFEVPLPGYVVIHASVGFDDEPTGTTMVTASEADGATTPQPDYWCDGLLAPLHRPLTLPARSRARIPLRMALLDDLGERVTAGDLSRPPVAQVRSGAGTQVLGSMRYRHGPRVWTSMVDSRQFSADGTYTVEAMAGDGSYDIELCEQTVTRR